MGGSYSFHQRPERALMERLPESSSIALWIVGSCWALAIVAYAFGASREWILPLFMLGLLTGIAEWILRRKSK
jgi:predicted metal-binding membrane protein